MDILTDKKVTTRKTQQCHGCCGIYPPKTKMRYVTAVDGGDISSVYWCLTCEEVIEGTWDYHDLDNGIQFGDVKDFDIPLWESINLKYQ